MSLVPSVTETLLAWGIPPVACTRFCEQPDLPHVGGTKNPDIPAIVDLAPDVVVMCVEENRLEDAEALEDAGLQVGSLSPDSVDDVVPAMRTLADLVGAPAQRVDDLEVDIEQAVAQAAEARTSTSPRRAFVPIWRRPWMTLAAGTYGSSLLAALGIENIYGDATDRYPEATLDAAAARQPDVVLAPSEPYPFRERHVADLEPVAPVVLVDGQDLFWWGARTPGALRRLADRLLVRN